MKTQPTGVMTQKEVAERLGISRPLVQYYETRALKKLRKLLEENAKRRHHFE